VPQILTCTPSDTLDAIPGLLECPARLVPTDEDRTGPAAACDRQSITILPLVPPYTPLRMTARKISKTGLGLISRLRFKAGDRFVISIEAAAGLTLKLCQIGNCRATHGGFFSMGAAFLDSVDAPPGCEGIPLLWLGLQIRPDGIARMSSLRCS
jgi:hypothetical protein